MIYLDNILTAQTISIPRQNVIEVAPPVPSHIKLERKNYTILQNGDTPIVPTAGYNGISGGTISVNVPQVTKPEQTKTVTYTTNGTKTISPDANKVLSGVTVNINVPTGSTKEEQSKTVTYTSNGTRTVSPDSGKVLSGVTVNVNVPTPSPQLERKNYTITANTITSISPSQGYDGISGGTISVSVPHSNLPELNSYLLQKYSIYIHQSTSFISDWETNGVTTDGRCIIIGRTIKAFAGSDISDYTIGDGPYGIGEQSFADCSLTSVTISNSILQIGNGAFMSSDNLQNVVFGSEVTSIEPFAFFDCGLINIDIPSNVDNIGHNAFYENPSLTSVTVRRINPPSLGMDAFDSTLQHIYVPAQSVDLYKGSGDWSRYADIIQAIP